MGPEKEKLKNRFAKEKREKASGQTLIPNSKRILDREKENWEG